MNILYMFLSIFAIPKNFPDYILYHPSKNHEPNTLQKSGRGCLLILLPNDNLSFGLNSAPKNFSLNKHSFLKKLFYGND